MKTLKSTPKQETQEFHGDKKVLVHFLAPYEKKLLAASLPHVPLQIGTAHLTLMTILWSIGVMVSGYLAQANILWMGVFSACIFLQYYTDMLDGAVGRERDTGLIKWGFYMDHFLDYVFLSSIIIGYSFLLPESYHLLTLACLAVTAGFMVHVLMDFSITNDFKISCSYFGVSESRMILIIFNTILMFTNRDLLVNVFPVFVGISAIALVTLVYKAQKHYAHLDFVHKEEEALKREHAKPIIKKGDYYVSHAK